MTWKCSAQVNFRNEYIGLCSRYWTSKLFLPFRQIFLLHCRQSKRHFCSRYIKIFCPCQKNVAHIWSNNIFIMRKETNTFFSLTFWCLCMQLTFITPIYQINLCISALPWFDCPTLLVLPAWDYETVTVPYDILVFYLRSTASHHDSKWYSELDLQTWWNNNHTALERECIKSEDKPCFVEPCWLLYCVRSCTWQAPAVSGNSGSAAGWALAAASCRRLRQRLPA